jgi:hypothetical protein
MLFGTHPEYTSFDYFRIHNPCAQLTNHALQIQPCFLLLIHCKVHAKEVLVSRSLSFNWFWCFFTSKILENINEENLKKTYYFIKSSISDNGK